MKKIIVSALFAVLATASMASAAVWTNVTAPTFVAGATGTGAVVAGMIGQTVFQVSTNVTLFGVGNAGGYNCSSKHLSGDKNYMSSSVSASIEENTGVKGVAMAALILSPTTANQYTGTAGY